MKKIIKNKYFLIAFVTPILIAGGLTYGTWKGLNYIQNTKDSIYQEGWEVGYMQGQNDGYEAAEEKNWDRLSKNPEVVKLLKKYFPEYSEARTMSAILEAESHHNPNTVNYNCYYTKDGKKYSTTCKKGDEGKAWSVDCGIAQLNYYGKVCPSWTMQPEVAIIKVKDMVTKRGFQPWVAYNNLSYKKYLK